MIRQADRRHFTCRGTMLWLLILFAIAEIPAASQKLKGKILDQSGQPVGYATVYVEEIKLGTTSNARGDYELRLPPGNYMVLFQSLGYEPVIESISIGEIDVEKNAVYLSFYLSCFSKFRWGCPTFSQGLVYLSD